jgi:hypothetical protein
MLKMGRAGLKTDRAGPEYFGLCRPLLYNMADLMMQQQMNKVVNKNNSGDMVEVLQKEISQHDLIYNSQTLNL